MCLIKTSNKNKILPYLSIVIEAGQLSQYSDRNMRRTAAIEYQ